MADFYLDDDSHPSPKLDVIDLTGARKNSGVDLFIVVASTLDADEYSQRRLLKKIENYLTYVASEEYQNEFGIPNPSQTKIVLHVRLGYHAAIGELINRCKPWVLENNAELIVNEHKIL